MDPMHLREVEARTRDTPFLEAARRERGGSASQILNLFAFKPEATRHLMRFTQAVMRGPSLLSPGLRELIAAHTSRRNRCPF